MFTQPVHRNNSKRTNHSGSGLTLAEVLVVATLMVLLLSLILGILLSSFRVSADGASKVELEQRLLLLAQRLTTDLKMASKSSVQVLGPSLSIHRRLKNPTLLAWDTDLVIYRLLDQGLERRVVPAPVTDRPFRPSSESEWQALLSAQAQEVRIFSDVSEFEVEVGKEALVTFSLLVTQGHRRGRVQRVVFLPQSGG